MFRISAAELGIDFGSSNTRIFSKEKGIILNEPTIITTHNNEMLAAGSRASSMVGRTPSPLCAAHPVKCGAISDIKSAQLLFAHFIKQCIGRTNRFLRPVKLAVCVPSSATDLEKHIFTEIARSTGCADIRLVDSSIAAAYGIGLDASAPRGRLIANLGSGTCTASVLSLNGIVTSKSISGGSVMDAAIADAVRENYNLIIGESSAEYLKQAIGSLHPLNKDLTVSIRGRSVGEGLPARVDVHSSVVTSALLPIAKQLAACVKIAYEDAPPELAADIFEDGIYLTGGLSLLHGMADLISETTGLHTHTCDRPFTSAAEGSLFAAPLPASYTSLGTA